MANSAPKIAEEERQEAPDVIDRKAQALAEQIRKSQHFIVFTGAGISTSAGIPDFRGPEGVWTLRAQGRQSKFAAVNTLQAVPTPTHMALVALQDRGILKYLVSQNCDGLHRKSGILPDMISELHGNSNREYCKDCGKEYIRDFRAVATYEKTIKDHRTGRKCTRCGRGALHDSIVNFGEPLPAEPLARAFEHAGKADLCLVLGSSLTVSPANEVPGAVVVSSSKNGGRKKKGRLSICNLQTTPLDARVVDRNLRVHARTDELMVRVMEKLDIPIPAFVLRRRLLVTIEREEARKGKGKANDDDDERRALVVRGVDVDGTPVSFLRSVKLEDTRRVVRSEPFVISLRGVALEPRIPLKLQLEFMGHYGEPNLELVHEYHSSSGSGGDDDVQTLYLLEYNPQTGQWKVGK